MILYPAAGSLGGKCIPPSIPGIHGGDLQTIDDVDDDDNDYGDDDDNNEDDDDDDGNENDYGGNGKL